MKPLNSPNVAPQPDSGKALGNSAGVLSQKFL